MKTTVSYPEPELIDLLEQRDPQACRYLYDRYAGALQGLISQIIPETTDREELLKKAFITICGNIRSFDPTKSRLFTWMLNIARETALEKLKSNKTRISIVGGQALKTHEGFGQLVTKLNKEEQHLINLSYFRGYSIEDVARQLNIPVEKVKEKMRLALLQLNPMF